MGFLVGKIFRSLSIAAPLLFCAGASLFAQTGTGTSASISDFALPEYRKDGSRLQFILYGKKASNLGAFIHLTEPVLDLVKDDLEDISQLKTFKGADLYPMPDFDQLEKLSPEAKLEHLRKHGSAAAAFWKNYPHCQVLISSGEAVYDKNAKNLRGDGKAFLRSREMDIQGVGFDADYERRIIHLRSKVKVIIRPEVRTRAQHNNQTITEDSK